MPKTKLPTFRKWAAKLVERRRALFAALFVTVCFAIAHESLRRYFAAPLDCDQPCREGVDCEPLSLSVEVKPAKIKAGAPHALWYRAELRNRTCQRLGGLNAGAFIDSKELLGKTSGLWITVTGPDGRELKRLPRPQADGGARWDFGSAQGQKTFPGGTIHPYREDEAVYQKALRSGKLSDNWFLHLDPGEAFATIPSKLRPYRIVATSSSRGGGFSHGYAWVDADAAPSFPVPPVGFQAFDRYLFKHPGRYSVRFGYVAEPSFMTVNPHWEVLSKSIQKWLSKIGLSPDYGLRFSKTEIRLETAPQVIEVLP